jgi:trans-aconitate 2-methyltransferase
MWDPAMWDPAQYLRFSDERSRPFFDLTGRVLASEPRQVVDLGCGPGNLTTALASRWPGARVTGVDSSAEMIAAADRDAAAGPAMDSTGSLSFAVGDVREWQPESTVDVIVSNAVLQWVPGHEELLPAWAAALAPDGWLAFQVPGNYDQPSHVVLRDLAGSARWRPLLDGVELNRSVASPEHYADLLARNGCQVDAWETTYLHVLPGEDPVTQWYKGTGLRPVLTALEPGEAAEFLAEYSARVRRAYPRQSYGTVLPFRRVFVVARRLA